MLNYFHNFNDVDTTDWNTSRQRGALVRLNLIINVKLFSTAVLQMPSLIVCFSTQLQFDMTPALKIMTYILDAANNSFKVKCNKQLEHSSKKKGSLSV